MPNNENDNLENINKNIQDNPNFQGFQQDIPIQQETPKPEMEIPQINSELKESTPEETTNSKTDNIVTLKIIPLIIINAIIIYAIFYSTVNKNVLISAGILIYVILGSIIFAIKDKDKSDFPTSIIIGGMLDAVVLFVISMLNEENMDLWTYYTIASAATGIIGLIVSNIITNVIANIKKVKALQTIGYLLFFVLLIGGPYYAYQKWPTEFYQIVFYQKNEVIAQSYEDYVLKTLKARYDLYFTCNFSEKRNYKTEKNEIMSIISCSDPNNNTISVRTLPYNESEYQYIVIDDYLETIYLKEIKEDISNKVQQATGAQQVTTYLYPKIGCMFVGDCADCEDYYKVYSEVNNSDKRYKISTKLSLSKYINLSTEDFIKDYINNNNYKVILHIKGSYSKESSDFTSLNNSTFTAINSVGLTNTNGYEITYYNFQDGTYETKVHKEIGNTNETKEFK